MPSVPETSITLDHGSKSAVLRPQSGSPATWKTELQVDHDERKVAIRTLAADVIFQCGAAVDSYTILTGSFGVESVVDMDVTRIGQRLIFDPILPSTNGREFPVVLVEYSEPGPARQLKFTNGGFAAPFGVQYIEGNLYEYAAGVWSSTSPREGGQYRLKVSFRQISQ